MPVAAEIARTLMPVASSNAICATEASANRPGRIVKFDDGGIVAAIGQGSARLGQGRHPEAAEEDAPADWPLAWHDVDRHPARRARRSYSPAGD